MIEKDDLFVLASDNLFTFNLQNLIDLSKEKDSSTVVLKIVNDLELVKKYSCVLLNNENKITFFEEKPPFPCSNICSTACYFLKKQDLGLIKNHTFTKTTAQGGVVDFLHKQSQVYGKLFEDFWIDIGSYKELEKARKYYN
jgi:glucose-1-phosphate thymidylyltransferase